MRLPLTKFLLVIKLFELDTSVREAARELDLAYNTIYSLHTLIRRAILVTDTESFTLSGEIEMDESDFGGRRRESEVEEQQVRFLSLASWSGKEKSELK